ncbi:uncharacterized protein LOC130738109 [Lotus japonicus]|uniref:uncharacterized protein LOC130738109 n=1 Tax=Lotus japonicus TaxID=34305 RepID=UPI002590092D|nr:uncharacterized protein LOC130738109 [Lotus japonicus]
MVEEERYATVGEQPSEAEEDLTSEETLEPNVEAAEEDRVAAEALRKESKFASDVEKNLTFAMKGFNLASEVAMPQLEMKSGKILHVQNGDVLGTMLQVAAEATLTETTMQPPWKRPHTFLGGPEKTKRSPVKPPNTLVCMPEMVNRPPAKLPNIGALWASTSVEFIVASRAPMGKRDDRLKMSLLQCRKEDLPPSLDPSEHSTPAKFATSQTAREVSTRAIPQAKEMKAANMQVQFLPLISSKSTICVVIKGKVEDKRQAKLITVTMREWYCFWNDLKTETRPARIGSELNIFSKRMGQSQNTKRGDWALQQNSGVKLIDWANLSAFGSKPNLPMYLKQGTRTHFKELQRTMLLTTSVGIEEDGIAVSKLYFSFDCELQHSFGHLGTGQEQDSILGLLIDPGGHNMRMGEEVEEQWGLRTSI